MAHAGLYWFGPLGRIRLAGRPNVATVRLTAVLAATLFAAACGSSGPISLAPPATSTTSTAAVTSSSSTAPTTTQSTTTPPTSAAVASITTQVPTTTITATASAAATSTTTTPPAPTPDPESGPSSYPLVCRPWAGAENRPELTELERIALHDLWWTSGWDLGLGWEISEAQPYRGLSTDFVDVENDPDLAVAIERRAELRRLNPHLNVLVSLFYREGEYVANEEDHRWWELGHFPPNSPFWIRDEAGMPVPGFGEDADGDGVIEADEALSSLVDFRMPEVIELVAQRAQAVQRTGVADGIMLDWWNEHGLTATSYLDWSTFYMTAEEELESRLALIRRIRELVGDDFLILVNTNERTAPLSAPYANGTFMELYKPDWSAGYTREAVIDIEETLTWATEAFREPRINCLEGWRVVTDYGNAAAQVDERNSEENRQWMRLFTAMALTHSDEMVVFGDDNAEPTVDHLHNWYDFWDADLGQPVGPKRATHQGVDGLFIREFTNGYAVYNRSGTEQEIHFPDQYTSVSAGQVASTHLVADMDGEIFLHLW